tara:strand:+ start:128 stop:913 length:786 start_codon:yes stop_codon:yes gene_type:complete
MSLTSKTPADTYKDILEIDNSNNGVGSTSKAIKTGNGASTSLSVSDRALSVTSNTDNTSVFQVKDNSGDVKLNVDTTNDQVKALGHHINTQYATFGISHTLSNGFVINTHHPIPFSNMATDDSEDIVGFGTGTDPATSFTTADGANTDASNLVPMLWYVCDNISIDQVIGIEGGDNATGDTTRMHLMSYDFTSGSTSCLTNGTLLAHNSDVTNAGSEQAYKSTFTIDSASVASGKVILAFFRSDSINSDYSVNITVKYHLT